MHCPNEYVVPLDGYYVAYGYDETDFAFDSKLGSGLIFWPRPEDTAIHSVVDNSDLVWIDSMMHYQAAKRVTDADAARRQVESM